MNISIWKRSALVLLRLAWRIKADTAKISLAIAAKIGNWWELFFQYCKGRRGFVGPSGFSGSTNSLNELRGSLINVSNSSITAVEMLPDGFWLGSSINVLYSRLESLLASAGTFFFSSVKLGWLLLSCWSLISNSALTAAKTAQSDSPDFYIHFFLKIGFSIVPIVTDGWSLFSHDYRLCVLLLVGNEESKVHEFLVPFCRNPMYPPQNLPFRVKVAGWSSRWPID